MAVQSLFDRILQGDVPSHKVEEGELWYAFLDIYPRRDGHTLVIPKQSVQRIGDLTPTVRNALFSGVVEVQKRLSKVFDTRDFTVCVHDGPLAGQEIPHVHVHVLPRTMGDAGETLMSMWPQALPMDGDVDHEHLAVLAARLSEVEV